MKTIQLYLQLPKESISELTRLYGLNKKFILDNDHQFYHMVMVGDEEKMNHQNSVEWDCEYIKCEVSTDDLLMAAVSAQLGGTHTSWNVKFLDKPYKQPSCSGKIVTIEGKQYKLTEIK